MPPASVRLSAAAFRAAGAAGIKLSAGFGEASAPFFATAILRSRIVGAAAFFSTVDFTALPCGVRFLLAAAVVDFGLRVMA